MIMEVFFLGTNASTPHRYRFLPSIVIRRKGELFMFDCGEGTQYRFLRSGLGVNKDMRIFISHMHGDHYLGLPGLIQTFSLLGRTKPLYIYGPPPLKKLLDFLFEETKTRIGYEVHYLAIENRVLVNTHEYQIVAKLTQHTIPNFAFAFIEKPKPGRFNREKAEELGIPRGRLWKKLQLGFTIKTPSGLIVKPEDVLGPPREGIKVVYTGDTRYDESLVSFAVNADLLIHDATFEEKLEKDAAESGHSTSVQAAKIARLSRAKFLFLFHYSSRYNEDLTNMLKEARSVFPRTFLSRDKLIVDIKKTEHYISLSFREF